MSINSDWGYLRFSHKGKVELFSLHNKTKEIFNTDSINLIRFKCACLIVGTPVFTLARVIGWFALSIFVTFENLYYWLDGKNCKDTSFSETAFEGLRSLYYGGHMTKHAMLGIYSPLDNRRTYGALERDLNYHLDGRPHRDKFYLAICCQPLANLSDPELGNKLLKYLKKVDDVLSAVKKRNLDELMQHVW